MSQQHVHQPHIHCTHRRSGNKTRCAYQTHTSRQYDGCLVSFLRDEHYAMRFVCIESYRAQITRTQTKKCAEWLVQRIIGGTRKLCGDRMSALCARFRIRKSSSQTATVQMKSDRRKSGDRCACALKLSKFPQQNCVAEHAAACLTHTASALSARCNRIQSTYMYRISMQLAWGFSHRLINHANMHNNIYIYSIWYNDECCVRLLCALCIHICVRLCIINLY